MNFLLMIGMMGLAMIFFHGRGHHPPPSDSGQLSVRPSVEPAPLPDDRGAPKGSDEPSRVPVDRGAKKTREVEPTPPPTAESAPQL